MPVGWQADADASPSSLPEGVLEVDVGVPVVVVGLKADQLQVGHSLSLDRFPILQLQIGWQATHSLSCQPLTPSLTHPLRALPCTHHTGPASTPRCPLMGSSFACLCCMHVGGSVRGAEGQQLRGDAAAELHPAAPAVLLPATRGRAALLLGHQGHQPPGTAEIPPAQASCCSTHATSASPNGLATPL